MPRIQRRSKKLSGWTASGYNPEMAISQDTSDASSRPVRRGWRRWLQFRLRTLLLFVVVIAFATNWLVGAKKRADRQKQAVDTIIGSGGWVNYDYQLTDPNLPFNHPRAWNVNAEMPGPAWLRSRLGDDWFRRPIWVTATTDMSANQVGDLPDILELTISHGPITDAGLARLGGLRNLRDLNVSGTWITDAGLDNIRDLKALHDLNLSDTKITDEGLRKLAGLTNLERLGLINTQATGAGLKWLAGL